MSKSRELWNKLSPSSRARIVREKKRVKDGPISCGPIPDSLGISVPYAEAKTKAEATMVCMEFVRNLFEHYKFPPVMLVCRDAAYFKDEGRWQVAVRVIRRPND